MTPVGLDLACASLIGFVHFAREQIALDLLSRSARNRSSGSAKVLGGDRLATLASSKTQTERRFQRIQPQIEGATNGSHRSGVLRPREIELILQDVRQDSLVNRCRLDE